MLVFDTSAFINGQRVHYPPATFPSVWKLVADAMGDGRIVVPRMVLEELEAKDDVVSTWAKALRRLFVDPTEAVQREIGIIEGSFDDSGVHDQADPFVLAEARVRGFAVVTYEGTHTVTGRPTPKADKKMPGICRSFGIDCCILPDALSRLGAQI